MNNHEATAALQSHNVLIDPEDASRSPLEIARDLGITTVRQTAEFMPQRRIEDMPKDIQTITPDDRL